MTMRSLEVAPSNAAQADAWDGSEGRYWAAHPDRFDLSVAQYQDRFLQAAQIDSRSTVLDVGCGTGETTREAARLATDGTALGVDLSADMIALARTLADSAGLTNATFAQADAQVYPFPEQGFDRVISRTGSMFFAEPAAAFANIARAISRVLVSRCSRGRRRTATSGSVPSRRRCSVPSPRRRRPARPGRSR